MREREIQVGDIVEVDSVPSNMHGAKGKVVERLNPNWDQYIVRFPDEKQPLDVHFNSCYLKVVYAKKRARLVQ